MKTQQPGLIDEGRFNLPSLCYALFNQYINNKNIGNN
jgi:hypothetical protein